MKNMKKWILKLPEIDKRWVVMDDDCVAMPCKGIRLRKYPLYLSGADIENLHAAVKTFGYEIWWVPSYTYGSNKILGYSPHYCTATIDDNGELELCKTPADAINAAFAAAVADKLKEMK